MTTSPGRACRAEIATPRGTTPMPAVLTNSLSAAPRSTTLVSPVTMVTPACVGDALHAGNDAAQDINVEAFLQHHAARQEAAAGRR